MDFHETCQHSALSPNSLSMPPRRSESLKAPLPLLEIATWYFAGGRSVKLVRAPLLQELRILQSDSSAVWRLLCDVTNLEA